MISELNYEKNMLDDINSLLSNIRDSNDKEKYYSYITNKKKNLIVVQNEKSEIMDKKNELCFEQHLRYDKISNELKLLDSINVPIVGMKGIFIKNKYYKSINRTFNDIDILIQGNDAKQMYKGLRKLGYSIELKTMYDNPIFNMNVIPEFYMEHTQTLMLLNKKRNISIDMHSNLNITNAHFIKSSTKFDTSELFKNSIPFGTYKNIKCLELHDNLCVLFRHLLKHHVFYGKTQTGLQTPIQHVLDLAVLINSTEFNANKLFINATKYNIIPETIFCLNLYNNIFKSCKKIDVSPYLNELENINYEFTWKPILMASLNMSIEDLMIGNYENEFPKLQQAVNISQSIPIKFVDWLCQSFIISFSIKHLLK